MGQYNGKILAKFEMGGGKRCRYEVKLDVHDPLDPIKPGHSL